MILMLARMKHTWKHGCIRKVGQLKKKGLTCWPCLEQLCFLCEPRGILHGSQSVWNFVIIEVRLYLNTPKDERCLHISVPRLLGSRAPENKSGSIKSSIQLSDLFIHFLGTLSEPIEMIHHYSSGQGCSIKATQDAKKIESFLIPSFHHKEWGLTLWSSRYVIGKHSWQHSHQPADFQSPLELGIRGRMTVYTDREVAVRISWMPRHRWSHMNNSQVNSDMLHFWVEH